MDEDAPLRTAHEWVRERLRRDILAGRYEPGEALKQTEIAASLQVSVTPVREAMRDLGTEGLLVVDPQRIARVRSLDSDEAGEIAEIRLRLEPLAARRAAEHADAEDIAQIRALAEASASTDSDAEWLEANQRFHLAVISASRSAILTSILQNVRQIAAIYLASAVRTEGGIRDKSAQEHLRLAGAIAAGDGDAAEQVMRAHLLPVDLVTGLTAQVGADGSAG